MLKETIITAKMLMVQNNLEVVTMKTLEEAINVIRTTFHDSDVSNTKTDLGFRGQR